MSNRFYVINPDTKSWLSCSEEELSLNKNKGFTLVLDTDHETLSFFIYKELAKFYKANPTIKKPFSFILSSIFHSIGNFIGFIIVALILLILFIIIIIPLKNLIQNHFFTTTFHLKGVFNAVPV
jgi:hypothetical protein